MRVILAVSLSLLILVGCGKDDPPPTAPVVKVWQGDFNQDGYPDIIGPYSLATKTFNVSCSDGYSGQENAISFNVQATQDVNEVTLQLTSSSTSYPEGTIIVESTPLTGHIEKSGDFIISQSAILETESLGRVSVTYNFDGAFTPTGWSGEYKHTVFLHSTSASCNYTSTFHGDKMAGTTSSFSKDTGASYLWFLGTPPVTLDVKEFH